MSSRANSHGFRRSAFALAGNSQQDPPQLCRGIQGNALEHRSKERAEMSAVSGDQGIATSQDRGCHYGLVLFRKRDGRQQVRGLPHRRKLLRGFQERIEIGQCVRRLGRENASSLFDHKGIDAGCVALASQQFDQPADRSVRPCRGEEDVGVEEYPNRESAAVLGRQDLCQFTLLVVKLLNPLLRVDLQRQCDGGAQQVQVPSGEGMFCPAGEAGGKG